MNPSLSTQRQDPPFRIRTRTEPLIVASASFWLLAGNQAFLSAALSGRDAGGLRHWGFALALAAGVLAIHVLLLGVLAHRRTIKPLVAVLTCVLAVASWFSSHYGVVMEPSMLRNVLRTDVAEARELVTGPLVLHLLLYSAVPLFMLSRVEVLPAPSWTRAVLARASLLAGALAVLLLVLASNFQALSSLMRLNKDLRYRIAPANVVWSVGAVLAHDLRGAAQPRQAIGLDAKPGPQMAGRQRPLVLVVVVGETARFANWGLAGYERDTTPRLNGLQVLDFGAVQSCGTNTEVSVPCLFAPVGRRQYDEGRIRSQESLLHVLARAGVKVHWRDNQSGCKGVCDGLPGDRPTAALAPGLCDGERCLDEALLHDLDVRLAAAAQDGGTQLWVLHMLGNHGPAYFKRYPAAFEHFQPACRDEDLGRCSQAAIVNAYDNALRYTDEVLARAIERLRAQADAVDSALIYVSDHGESLGEKGLFLHGMPYALAPDVQKQVPMAWWASAGFERGAGLSPGCLEGPVRERARSGGVAHDHLFHSILGLLDVQTGLHDPALDLVAPCRSSRGVSAAVAR